MFVCSLFNKSGDPVYASTYDGSSVEFYKLFLPNGGIKLDKVFENYEVVRGKICGSLINNSKKHVVGYGLGELDDVYEFEDNDCVVDHITENEAKKRLLLKFSSMKSIKFDLWRKLFARAQVAYVGIENTPIYLGGSRASFNFDHTWTGRSKCLGFNLQSVGKDKDLYLGDWCDDYYVHFDWVAADIRMAAFMAGDKILLDTYKQSDPYTELSKLTDGRLDRSGCKREMLAGIYSLSFDSPVFYAFPILKDWMNNRLDFLNSRGYLRSILKRKFSRDNPRSVFSGMIQGSVAHAMHSALYRIWTAFPGRILCETHDSITMMSDLKTISKLISTVARIMYRPFEDYPSLTLPLKIYVGHRWRDWKLYKVWNEQV